MINYAILLACILFTVYLLWLDVKKSAYSSPALWIVVLFMFLAGTREFTAWFNLGGAGHSLEGYMEGSLIDAVVQLVFTLSGLAILFRRNIDWETVVLQNKWVWLYFLFGAISIVWSDFPFISFKRLIKAMGTLVIALVILTDEDPYEALWTVLRRLSILVLPASIILCKYFPELGRLPHHGNWTYIGITTGKNMLGQLCLISGIYYSWHLLLNRSGDEDGLDQHPSPVFSCFFLGMIAYLLSLADSATSLVCLIIAICIFLVSRVPEFARRPQQYIISGILLLVIIGLLDETFKLRENVLSAIGRDKDLTSRHPMWEDLLSMSTNPLLGSGYESFWLGDNLKYLLYKYGGIIQSHNGYLETYLNLGIIGLALMVANIVSGCIKAMNWLEGHYSVGIIRLSIIVTVTLYNWTEASFYGVNNMFLLFFVAAMDVPAWPALTDT
jgi:exopolysaccharide production protein ExoQ